MDPLSDFLLLLKPRSYSAGGFDAGGTWSVQFPQYKGIKCYAVVSGSCWLSINDNADAISLNEGDCFVVTAAQSFILSNDLNAPPVYFKSIVANPLTGGVITYNGGGSCFLVGGHFILPESRAEILLKTLPAIIHLQSESEKNDLRWFVERMRKELREKRPGGLLVIQHLAHLILIQALRLHSEDQGGGVGWLFALNDAQLNKALNSMHGDLAFPWTVKALAERAGMSRSVFASNFKQKVGESPLDYLLEWRMKIAAEKLQNPNESISDIASAVGYQSESAFGKAFKRKMGCSPREYSRAKPSP